MKHPDLRAMLPSKEQEYLIATLLSLLEASPLNFLADPIFREEGALEEFRDVPGVTASRVLAAYQKARHTYEQKYPKGWGVAWSTDKSASPHIYRIGIPENQHRR